MRSGGMKPALSLVTGRVAIVFLQPLADRGVQDRGNRNSAEAGLAFQVGLEFAGQPPAIDFGLHALQCSASGSFARIYEADCIRAIKLLTALLRQKDGGLAHRL